MKVLITDHVWPNVDVERRILSTVGAEVIVSPNGSEAELARLAAGCDAIMTCFAQVTPAVLRAAPRCLQVARYGIGVDNIALETATELGIVVTNVPAFCVDEVAEHALGLLLACARRIPLYDRATHSGRWDNLMGRPLFRVSGSTLGIVGFGKIGRSLARKASGMDLRILVHDPALRPGDQSLQGVEVVDFDTLLGQSDFISLHLPLTPETRGLMGEAQLRKMKRTAYLLNTSRGPIIDTVALERALREGWIAGAGLDVMPQEPPATDDPLLALDNLVLTPHASFYSEQSLVELQTRAVEEVVRVLSGQRPRNVVNPEVLPRARAAHLRQN
ncbi:MAG: C-terminal binding protein [Chloroflexi bacterium]|nr:C-terminal binding protein [Chloroflexota bacterium]